MPRSSPAKPPARDSAEGCRLKAATGSRAWVPLPRTKRSSNHSESKEMRGSGKEEGRGGGEGAAEREEKEGKGNE